MSVEDVSKSMVAHLFLEGKPLVLNYQLMESRLNRARLTPAQRAEYERQLRSEGGFLTVADHERDMPLLIHFHSDNDRYTLRVATPGKFYGYFLSMESILDARGEVTSTRNLVVLEKGAPTRFYLETVAPDLFRLRNVARKSSASEELLGGASSAYSVLKLVEDQLGEPTYFYKQEGRLRNDPQQYFSDTFLRAEHVIFWPHGVHLGLQVRGTGVLELSDVG